MSAGEKDSFWLTVPGIITALATLVTALAGAYVTVTPSKIDKTCLIKGNISQNSGAKIYHLPGDKDYESTIIDPSKGEKMFCTESEAMKNGWEKSPK